MFFLFPAPVRRLFTRLIEKNCKLIVAESLTGGLLGAQITAMPGSSRIFWGGVIAYSNQAKQQLLGVDTSLIESFGPVSAPVAEAMATAAVRMCPNAVALAVTGFAGPTGGTESLPVGSVWIAAAMNGIDSPVVCESRLFHFYGTRKSIRRKTLNAAFAVGLELLDR